MCVCVMNLCVCYEFVCVCVHVLDWAGIVDDVYEGNILLLVMLKVTANADEKKQFSSSSNWTFYTSMYIRCRQYSFSEY